MQRRTRVAGRPECEAHVVVEDARRIRRLRDRQGARDSGVCATRLAAGDDLVAHDKRAGTALQRRDADDVVADGGAKHEVSRNVDVICLRAVAVRRGQAMRYAVELGPLLAEVAGGVTGLRASKGGLDEVTVLKPTPFEGERDLVWRIGRDGHLRRHCVGHRLGHRHRKDGCHDVEEKCDEDGDDAQPRPGCSGVHLFSPSGSLVACRDLSFELPITSRWRHLAGPGSRALGANGQGSWPVNSECPHWCRRLPRAAGVVLNWLPYPWPAALAGRRSISSGPRTLVPRVWADLDSLGGSGVHCWSANC